MSFSLFAIVQDMEHKPNNQEKAYLAKVRQVINDNKEPVKTVDELAAIDVSSKEGFSLNTLNIINYIDGLDFEREDGELEGGGSGNEAYDRAERNIAMGILDKVTYILADIEKGNWYRYVYSVDFVYSQLKNGVYSYRSVTQSINATTREEAEKQKDKLKQAAPKAYLKEPGFTLEDVRISAELVDSNGKRVN